MAVTRRKLTVAGVNRSYLLAEPAGTPSGIVLSLHGSSSTADQQARYSAMATLADSANAVVAFPQAATPARRGYIWDHRADLAFLRTLTDQLRSDFPTPTERVCAAGMSGGARMSCEFAWACPDDVAVVGAVAGLRASDLPPPSRPVAVVAFHGTADRINPYLGGGREYWGESVTDAARRWAVANGVAPTAIDTEVSESLTRSTYGVAGEEGEVTLWVIKGGGHTWPGGRSRILLRLLLGATSGEVDATAEIWRFFLAHTT
jgi:polyhydroxybutyrate depolymerase